MSDLSAEAQAKLILDELLGKLAIEAETTSSLNPDGMIHIAISSEEQGVLIGHHGENLSALQTILRAMMYRKNPDFPQIVLDVGGYRREREEKLYALAKKYAEKARLFDTEVDLPPMPAHDRRIVHLAINEFPGVESDSVGEGTRRYIVIRPISPA